MQRGLLFGSLGIEAVILKQLSPANGLLDKFPKSIHTRPGGKKNKEKRGTSNVPQTTVPNSHI